jgi:hypothetical protein
VYREHPFQGSAQCCAEISCAKELTKKPQNKGKEQKFKNKKKKIYHRIP